MTAEDQQNNKKRQVINREGGDNSRATFGER